MSFKRKWIKRSGKVKHGTDWAKDGTFAGILYRTYSEEHYQQWSKRYNPQGITTPDFGKPGSGNAGAQDRQSGPVFMGWHQGPGQSEDETAR